MTNTDLKERFIEESTMSDIIAELEAENMKSDVPAFAPSDTVVVQVRVREGSRER